MKCTADGVEKEENCVFAILVRRLFAVGV